MAVSNQDNPNLTPAYGQIMAQLENRANLESKRPTLAGTAAGVVTHVANKVEARQKEQRAFEQKMAGEGRTLVTKDGISEFAKETGLDPEDFKSFEGLWVKPEEAIAFGEQRAFSKMIDSQNDIGEPIDTTRPIINNKDGSYSTERSITVGMDGKFINIPTIIDGKEVTPDEAIEYARKTGKNLGVFDTEAAALKAAEARTKEIDRLRGGGAKTLEGAAARVDPNTAAKNVLAKDKTVEQVLIEEYKKGKMTLEELVSNSKKLKTGGQAKYLRDTERGITYQVTEDGLVPVIGGKGSGPAKGLDDLEKNDRKEVVEIKNKFRPIFGHYREVIDTAGQLEKALSAKNPVLDVAMRVKMAKLFGDTGNIAVVEQAQYGGSPALAAEVVNMVSRKFEGVTSPENRTYLLQAVRSLGSGIRDNLSTQTKREMTTLKDAYNVDEDFAHIYLTGEKLDKERDAAIDLLKSGKKQVTEESIEVAKKVIRNRNAKNKKS